MPLRSYEDLGLQDPTVVGDGEVLATATAARAPRPGKTPSRRPARPRRAEVSRSAIPSIEPEAAPHATPLDEERRPFVQIMAAESLHQRLEDASYALRVEHPELRHHKTILGALVWRYVKPDEPEVLQELGGTLDDYLASQVSREPGKVKVGAHLPFSLKHRLDGAGLALRRTRRDATARTLLSALIWTQVDPANLDPLVELLGAYHEASRPQPTPLTSLVAG